MGSSRYGNLTVEWRCRVFAADIWYRVDQQTRYNSGHGKDPKESRTLSTTRYSLRFIDCLWTSRLLCTGDCHQRENCSSHHAIHGDI